MINHRISNMYCSIIVVNPIDHLEPTRDSLVWKYITVGSLGFSSLFSMSCDSNLFSSVYSKVVVSALQTVAILCARASHN